VEKLSSSIEQYQMVLSRLFGTKDLDALMSLPREELLNLALSTPTPISPSPSVDTTEGGMDQIITHSQGVESLEALEQAPENVVEEWEDNEEDFHGIADDINGLSMRVDKHTSYVGISSINAALKVIYKTTPTARALLQNQMDKTRPKCIQFSPPPCYKDRGILPTKEEGHRMAESYFHNVHPFFPMVDEGAFWKDLNAGQRTDAAWMGLQNIVFALGSLANGNIDNEDHVMYYRRARDYVSPKLDSFRYPNIETLQITAMVGGYYMHYLNRPNEGDLTMGAAMRIACSLGLHREYLYSESSQRYLDSDEDKSKDAPWIAEVRRRTWWSLFCLDTWATTTTGRPSLGRLSRGVTVHEPGKMSNVSSACFHRYPLNI
jgi:hypothetical protein